MSGRGHELPAECLPLDIALELICTACAGIIRDPVQTRCGHRYCEGCLEEILRLVVWVIKNFRNDSIHTD